MESGLSVALSVTDFPCKRHPPRTLQTWGCLRIGRTVLLGLPFLCSGNAKWNGPGDALLKETTSGAWFRALGSYPRVFSEHQQAKLSGDGFTTQKTGIPKWVALVSGNMGTKTCGLPLRSFNFEPHPCHVRGSFPCSGAHLWWGMAFPFNPNCVLQI